LFDLSLERFGFNCGVGRSYISQLESGKRLNPSPDLLEQIEFRYGLSPAWLKQGRGDPFVSQQTNELASKSPKLPFPLEAEAPDDAPSAKVPAGLHVAHVQFTLLAETLE